MTQGFYREYIILSVDGAEVEVPGSLAWQIAITRPGTTIQLEVARGRERKTVPLIVEAPPE